MGQEGMNVGLQSDVVAVTQLDLQHDHVCAEWESFHPGIRLSKYQFSNDGIHWSKNDLPGIRCIGFTPDNWSYVSSGYLHGQAKAQFFRETEEEVSMTNELPFQAN